MRSCIKKPKVVDSHTGEPDSRDTKVRITIYLEESLLTLVHPEGVTIVSNALNK